MKMPSSKNNQETKTSDRLLRNYSIRAFIANAKTLQGDPHYVAVGMAIGVFIGITPTIPLHTVIAVALAFVLRGSKPAAIIGVWFANPITIPLFYWASYEIGAGCYRCHDSRRCNPWHSAGHCGLLYNSQNIYKDPFSKKS